MMHQWPPLAFSMILAVTSLFGTQGQSQPHSHNEARPGGFEEQVKSEENRWTWQMPQRVMDAIGVEKGMTVADVGAGIGYFSLKLSERVGASGMVYASDIDEQALAVLSERGRERGAVNIAAIRGKDDDPCLPMASADLVLIVNTIHLVKDKSAFLARIRPSLKRNGKVVFIQWDAEKMDSESSGWDAEDRERYTLRTMLRTIYDADYEVIAIKDFLPMQLIYICRTSERPRMTC